MSKRMFSTILIVTLFIISLCSYSFAASDTMNQAKDAVMNAGNSIGSAAVTAKNAVVDGAKDITNGASTVGKDAVNTTEDAGRDGMNVLGDTASVLDDGDRDYTATRTATGDSNLLGMSTTTWTWLILGIVGIIIVALVWYYGSQYEHRNYNND